MIDDPFASLTNQSNILPTNSGNIFQFLNTSSTTPGRISQPQQPHSSLHEGNKDMNNISVSSINNVSKHSFEEVDKNEPMIQTSMSTNSNYYIAPKNTEQ